MSRLQCASPSHLGDNKDTMFFLWQKDNFYVFACRDCSSRNRQLQIHVLAPSRFAEQMRQALPKATSFDRDQNQNVISFR